MNFNHRLRAILAEISLTGRTRASETVLRPLRDSGLVTYDPGAARDNGAVRARVTPAGEAMFARGLSR